MKIACLLGSPRKDGNSALIAGQFLATAEELGARTRSFFLNWMSYQGCQACNSCKEEFDYCVQMDDLTEALEAVREADVVVMASPVYFGDVSGQMKNFIDRTFSYFTPDFITNPNRSRLAPGKKLVFILAQGKPDANFFCDIFTRYKTFFTLFGFNDFHLIRAFGFSGPSDTADRSAILQHAREIARQVAG